MRTAWTGASPEQLVADGVSTFGLSCKRVHLGTSNSTMVLPRNLINPRCLPSSFKFFATIVARALFFLVLPLQCRHWPSKTFSWQKAWEGHLPYVQREMGPEPGANILNEKVNVNVSIRNQHTITTGFSTLVLNPPLKIAETCLKKCLFESITPTASSHRTATSRKNNLIYI